MLELLAWACFVLLWFGEEPPVISPAVEWRPPVPPSSPGEFTEGPTQPELVVVGKIKPGKPDEGIHELLVEKVLYGTCATTSIRVSSPYLAQTDGIFTLSGDPVPRIQQTHPRSDEKGLRALGDTRLDYNVLSADAIVLGTIVRLDDDSTVILVFRSLTGDSQCGTCRPLASKNGGLESILELVRREPTMYFLQRDGTGNSIRHRQHASRENDVRAALRLREHPLVYSSENAGYCREIMFRGTLTDAVEFLGSNTQAVHLLGSRRLILEGQKSKALVVAEIERGLVDVRAAQADNRRTRALIHILGTIQATEGKDDLLRRLIERQFTLLATNPAAPSAPKSRNYLPHEAEREDVNRGLLWLLLQLPEDVLHRDFGPKLLALRDKVQGYWKHETQLILDVCRIEEQREVESALRRMKDIKPVRSPTIMHHHDVSGVTFSHDGRYLATIGEGGVRVWDTRTWSQAGGVTHSSSIEKVRFSPDGRFLYIAFGAGKNDLLTRYDWRTGVRDRTYSIHKSGLCGLELSADGKRMATADYYDAVFHISDTETGKSLVAYPMKDLQHAFTFSPDGKLLVRAAGKREEQSAAVKWSRQLPQWTVETLQGKTPEVPGLQNADTFLFSPAGRYLILAEPPAVQVVANDNQVTIRVLDTAQGFKEIGTRKDENLGTFLTISADGKRVASASLGRDAPNWGGRSIPTLRFTILSLPRLEPISVCEVAVGGEIDLRETALSPDGKILAAAVKRRATPYLFDTQTGKALLPSTEHKSDLGEVFFAADGKTLHSLTRNRQLCVWDAQTLRFLRRVTIAEEGSLGELASVGVELIVFIKRSADKAIVTIVSMTDGKILSRATLPEKLISYFTMRRLDESQAMLVMREHLVRVDYRTGKILEVLDKKAEPEWTPFSGELSEDGRSLYDVHIDVRSRLLRVNWSDLSTGKIHTIGEKDLTSLQGESWGLVPGGKHFWVGDPGFYLLERNTLRVVASRPSHGVNMRRLTLTPDGRHYAVVADDRPMLDKQSRRFDSDKQSVVRIYEKTSGKLLGAFPSGSKNPRLRFAPDGKRLLVVGDDDSLEMRSLASLFRP